MRKITALLLALCIIIGLCACANASYDILYKRIEYANEDALEKRVIFVIPDSWSYAETSQGDKMIEFRDQNGKEIGDVRLNAFYSGEEDLFSLKETVAPLYKEPKFKKLSKECFITTVKEKGNIITYRVEKDAIDIFLDLSVSDDIAKQIAKNIEAKDFEEKKIEENASSQVSSQPAVQSSDTTSGEKPDISFLEDPSSWRDGLGSIRLTDIFNAVGCNMHILGRPNVGALIRFENNYTSSRLALMGIDGHIYEFVDNFRKRRFELVKRTKAGWNADSDSNELLMSKPLPGDCNLVTEYNEYMLNFADSRSFISFEQADEITDFPYLCQHLNEKSLMPEKIDVSQNGMLISTKLYIPEAMAFLYIDEDYNQMKVKFKIAAINGETSHLSSKLKARYTVEKSMRDPALAIMPKDRFRYKEFGVIFP